MLACPHQVVGVALGLSVLVEHVLLALVVVSLLAPVVAGLLDPVVVVQLFLVRGDTSALPILKYPIISSASRLDRARD